MSTLQRQHKLNWQFNHYNSAWEIAGPTAFQVYIGKPSGWKGWVTFVNGKPQHLRLQSQYDIDDQIDLTEEWLQGFCQEILKIFENGVSDSADSKK